MGAIRMTNEIPEGGWPSIPILAPYETPAVPTFETSLITDLDESIVDEILAFYKTTLIPQLACAPDGMNSPYPGKGWLMSSQQKKWFVICRADDVLRGVWVVKQDGQIFYPCATIDYIAAIFRALWVETIQHFDYVWGSTENPIILEFAKKAEHVPRNSMDATVSDGRLEWRRS
jgi:hypothetical protein